MTYQDIKFEKLEIKPLEPKPDSYYRQHWWQFWKPKKFDWSKWKIEEYQEVQCYIDPTISEDFMKELQKSINASRND